MDSHDINKLKEETKFWMWMQWKYNELRVYELMMTLILVQ
jgi:hypothetical protein